MGNGDPGIRRLRIKVKGKGDSIDWSLDRGFLDGKYVDVTDGTEELRLPQRDVDSIQLLIDTLRLLTDLSREGKLEKPKLDQVVNTLEDLVRILGESLYNVLFKGKIREYLESMVQDDRLDFIRIQLEFEGERGSLLSSWPWEYLHIPADEKQPESGQFLALATQLMLNRRLALHLQEMPELKTHQPVRVLVIAANPNPKFNLAPVRGDMVIEVLEDLQEKKKVSFELKMLVTPEFELSEDYDAVATAQAAREEIDNFNPHIIHFIGHGKLDAQTGRSMLAFVHKNGDIDWVEDKTFANWVKKSKNIKLVFLQACESALPDPYIGISGVAKWVANKRIPAVVAMQYKIEEEVADTFARHFYQSLAEGNPVDMAVKSGREAISELPQQYGQHRAFGLPVLYLHSYGGMIAQEEARSVRRGGFNMASDPTGAEAPLESCPRCRNQVKPKHKFCTRCRLSFYCANCSTAFDDPVNDKYCGFCSTAVHQNEWVPDEHKEKRPAELLFSVSPPAPPIDSVSGLLGDKPPSDELQNELKKRRPHDSTGSHPRLQ